jgi:hypothetical protein
LDLEHPSNSARLLRARYTMHRALKSSALCFYFARILT